MRWLALALIWSLCFTPLTLYAEKAPAASRPEDKKAAADVAAGKKEAKIQGPINLPLGTPLKQVQENSALKPDISQLSSSRWTVWLVDENGQVQPLLEKQGNAKFEPATTTKLFTALIAYDKLAGRLKEKVTITKDDLKGMENARVVGFSEGEEVTIEDLFFGDIIDSGGDASQALARLSYGSEAQFVKVMNEQARALGLSNSKFSNSTGLSAEGDSTTTNDMATILTLAATRPQLVRMMATPSYKTTPSKQHPQGILMQSILFQDIEQSKLNNRDHKTYIQGGRPGWSPDGAFTMTSFTRIGKKLLVAVSAGAESAQARFTDHDKLYAELIGKQHDVTIFQPNQLLTKIPLKNGSESDVEVYMNDNTFTASLPAILGASDLEYRYLMPEFFEAPVKKGSSLGHVQVLLNDRVIYDFEAFATKDYSSRAIAGLANGLAGFYHKTPVGFVLVFLILLLGLIAGIIWYNRRVKRRELLAELEAKRAAEEAEKRLKRELEERKWQEYRSKSFTTGGGYHPPKAGSGPRGFYGF